jgi:hypothetical protein
MREFFTHGVHGVPPGDNASDGPPAEDESDLADNKMAGSADQCQSCRRYRGGGLARSGCLAASASSLIWLACGLT